MIAGDAALSVATSNARPGLRTAVEIAVAVRVAGSGPPKRVSDHDGKHGGEHDRETDAQARADDDFPDVDEREHEQDHEQHAADAPEPGFEPRGARRGNAPHRHAEGEWQQLGDEYLSRELPRIGGRAAGVVLVECGDPQRHGADREHSHRDLQRRRKRPVAARAQRTAQRDRRARCDRHQHDPDFRRPRKVQKARDEPRERGHRDEYREERSQEKTGPRENAAELAGHDRESQVEHDGEQGRDGDRREQPIRDGT